MTHQLRFSFVAAATLLLALAIHEMGHVLASRLLGARVAEIVVFSFHPHIQVLGRLASAGEAFIAVSGSGLFLAAYAALRLMRPPGELWRVVQTVASLFATIEILGWILSALVPSAVGPNDAADFISASGVSRYVVATGAAAIGLVGLFAIALVSRALERRGSLRTHWPTATSVPLAKSAANAR